MIANWYQRTICVGLLGLMLLQPVFAFSPYSNDELDELEKEFVEQINQASVVERSPLASQYLNDLGKRLARQSHTKVPRFFIVKSHEINAFAGPGGYIGINSQLILATDNESELASVMAHEIAHVRQHHLYRGFEHQKQMRIPMLASVLAAAALGAINPTLANGALMASLTGFAQDTINFTRAGEKEADSIGIDMLTKAGYDPNGMVRFFKKMQESSRYAYTDNIPAILRTHPLDDDRIAEAENRIHKSGGARNPESASWALFREYVRVSSSTEPKRLLDYYQNGCTAKTPVVACRYGRSLAYLRANQYQAALDGFSPLLQSEPNSLWFIIGTSEAEVGLRQYDKAITRLKAATSDYPGNYAALMALGEAQDAAGRPQEAATIFLKTWRLFPGDLPACESLARAQARAKMEGLAYFTEARCQLLQGRHRDAMRQLEQAQRNAGNNHLLKAQISALKEEVRFLSDTRK